MDEKFEVKSPKLVNKFIDKRIFDKEELLKPLLEGWRRIVVIRNNGLDNINKIRQDVYYHPPIGKKLRSSKELERFLIETGSQFTVENFTFAQMIIGLGEPYETQRTALYRAPIVKEISPDKSLSVDFKDSVIRKRKKMKYNQKGFNYFDTWDVKYFNEEKPISAAAANSSPDMFYYDGYANKTRSMENNADLKKPSIPVFQLSVDELSDTDELKGYEEIPVSFDQTNEISDSSEEHIEKVHEISKSLINPENGTECQQLQKPLVNSKIRVRALSDLCEPETSNKPDTPNKILNNSLNQPAIKPVDEVKILHSFNSKPDTSLNSGLLSYSSCSLSTPSNKCPPISTFSNNNLPQLGPLDQNRPTVILIPNSQRINIGNNRIIKPQLGYSSYLPIQINNTNTSRTTHHFSQNLNTNFVSINSNFSGPKGLQSFMPNNNNIFIIQSKK